jgi:hypothetical protein
MIDEDRKNDIVAVERQLLDACYQPAAALCRAASGSTDYVPIVLLMAIAEGEVIVHGVSHNGSYPEIMAETLRQVTIDAEQVVERIKARSR